MGHASTVPPEHLAPLHGLLQLGPVHVGGPVEGEGPASRPARTPVGPRPAAGPCLASTLGWAGPRGRPLPIAGTAAATAAAATTAAAVAPVGVVVATGGRPMRMPPAVVVPVRAALWWLFRAGARGSMPVVAAPAPAWVGSREVTGRTSVWCCLLVGVWPGRLVLCHQLPRHWGPCSWLLERGRASEECVCQGLVLLLCLCVPDQPLLPQINTYVKRSGKWMPSCVGVEAALF